MRNPFRAIGDWLDFRAQAIELSKENRELTADNHKIAQQLVHCAEANIKAGHRIIVLRLENEGLNAKLQARETLLREAEERISFLESEVALHRRTAARVSA